MRGVESAIMSESEVFKNFLASSRLFWRAAIDDALTAQGGKEQRWTFAAMNTAIAVEHTLKAHLAKAHLSLTRERPETPEKTVTPEVAIARLSDPLIFGLQLSESDKVALSKAVRLRNRIAHGETEIHKEALQATFAFTFAFLLNYHIKHFSLDRHEFLTPREFADLLKIRKQVEEFRQRAQQGLLQSQVEYETKEVFTCPECGEDFVTIEERRSVCHLCHEARDASLCENCERDVPEFDMEDFSRSFEWEYDEGLMHLVDDFGYGFRKCCSMCINDVRSDIREKIETAGWEQYYEDMQREYETELWRSAN